MTSSSMDTTITGFVPINVTSDYELRRLNELLAKTLVPAAAYVGLMMVLGVFGNSIVCFIFIIKMKRGTQNLLIAGLAAFELLSCFLAMPIEIADMMHFYNFQSDLACKFVRFLSTLFAVASVITLLAIALDRYQKICRPFNAEMRLKEAKLWLVCAVCLGVVFSCPAALIYRINRVPTKIPGLTGFNCTRKHDLLLLVYNVVMGIGIVGMTGSLAFMYASIAIAARKLTYSVKKAAYFPGSDGELKRRNSVFISGSTCDLALSDSICSVVSPASNDDYVSQRRFYDKTTAIGFTITLVFVISFIPFLTLKFMDWFKQDLEFQLTGGELIAYNIGIRSYFINSVANPIIYGALNKRFTREVIKMTRQIIDCNKPAPPKPIVRKKS